MCIVACNDNSFIEPDTFPLKFLAELCFMFLQISSKEVWKHGYLTSRVSSHLLVKITKRVIQLQAPKSIAPQVQAKQESGKKHSFTIDNPTLLTINLDVHLDIVVILRALPNRSVFSICVTSPVLY